MKLQILNGEYSVCKLASTADVAQCGEPYFLAVTDEEISLVCPTSNAPSHTEAREDGWRGFRIQGVLDFALIGILSELSRLLAEQMIGIFAISTFNTDYIFIKKDNLKKAVRTLSGAGYEIA